MNGARYYYTESGNLELILTQGQTYTSPWHLHLQHWTIGIVRRGPVFLATDTGACQLHAGQHFFIRPYEPHRLRVELASSLLVVCLADSDVYSAVENFFAPLRAAPLLQADEKMLIHAIVAARMKKISPGENDNDPLAACDSLIICSVREVIRLIMAKPAEALRLDAMASYAGYSPWHFLRAFQKVMSVTPHTFQLLCRLRLLRSMLRSDTASATAAVAAGFTDQSHMHKVFKRHHGTTPKAFKQACFKLELL